MRFLLSLVFLCILISPVFTLESDPPELRANAAVLMDASTGVFLYEKNPDARIPPASLTKLVTTHIALREAAQRGISLDDKMNLPPPSWARNQPPRSSLMWLDDGQIVTLRELLIGLAVPSGNDAAVAVALNFSPTIEQFSKTMTNYMRDLGLTETVFVEPSGISEDNWTTAREFSEFCREYIRLYPQNLKEFHSVQEFAYPKPENMPQSRRNNPRTIVHGNHIGLLNSYRGVDGLKTGYIDEAGYNIALTAERDGTRFVAVLLGVPAELGGYWGPRFRDADGAALLDWGYENFKTLYVEYPEFLPARIWKGRINKVPLVPVIKKQPPSNHAALTVVKTRGGTLTTQIEMYSGISAPLSEGTPLGEFIISDEQGELGRVALCAAEPVERGNIFKRIWDAILMFFMGIRSRDS